MTKQERIMEQATKIKDNEVLTLVNSTIEVLKNAYSIGVDTYNVTDIESLQEKEYQAYENNGMEVMQYWLITEWLGEKLAKKGAIVTPYENHYYLWGRTGYGYDMADDFLEIAEDVISYLDSLKK